MDGCSWSQCERALIGDSHDRQIHVYRKVTMEIFLRVTKICPRESKVSMAFLPADALICGHFYSYEAVRSYYGTVVLNSGCLAFVFGYSFQITTVTPYTHRILAGALAATRGRVNCGLTFHFLRALDKRGFACRVNRL